MKLVSWKNGILLSDVYEVVNVLKGVGEIEVDPCLSRRAVRILPNESLEKVWSKAVPAGFTPWNRYPISDVPNENLYYYYGHWQPMMDSLMSMGRGDAVWNSFLCASKVEAQTWDGDRLTERKCQMLLHLLGFNPGPIDGMIGHLTTRAIREAGVSGKLESIVSQLEKRLSAKKPIKTPTKKTFGEISFPETPCQVQGYGKVQVVKTKDGAKVEVLGKGRLIVDF